jgi:hypothetical protein
VKTDIPDLDVVGDMFVLPDSFAEQSLWFLDQLNPQTFAYNLSGAVRIVGNLDVDASKIVADR